MSFIPGTNYGFLFPYALAAAPVLLGVLIFAYLKRGQGVRVPVATLLILRNLQRHSATRKKFVPPFRFFYELLLLTLLLIGAAGFFKEGEHEQVAILIDNSFSMAARNPTDPATTILENAGSQATRILHSLSGQDKVELFTSAPGLRSITEGLVDPATAARHLSDLRLSYTGDNLEGALARISANPNFKRIVVLTGRPVHKKLGAQHEQQNLDTRVDLQSLISDQMRPLMQNAAISAVHLLRSQASKAGYELTAQVEAYTSQPLDVLVTLEAAASPQNPERLRNVSEMRLRLQAASTEKLVFKDLPKGLAAFKLSLRAEAGATKLDLIKEDNQAWVTPETETGEVILIGDFGPQALGLNNLRALSFQHMRATEYESGLADNLEPAPQMLIFHHYLPSKLPTHNSLFVLPHSGNHTIPVLPEVQSAQLTRWQAHHPILSYLNLTPLTLKKIRPLGLPAWGEELVSSDAGPLVIAGEQLAHRYVAVGFEIFPYVGIRAPILSIFTLNALNWISGGGLKSGYQNAGSVIKLPLGTVSARYVGGSEIYRAPTDMEAGSRPEAALPVNGLVQIVQENSKIGLIAVNYFDAQESNLLAAAPLQQPASHSTRTEDLQKYLWTKRLAMVALALCILELIFLFAPFAGRALSKTVISKTKA
ncbi:MAG: VWA domain-containing protein [Deltaproteobacteria bacterium]|nr:VWA domain-containing protein [Deltaproteobacteria bacterium]